MTDSRKIRFQGEELGIHSIDSLYRIALQGDIDHTAEFWSERDSAWRPLAGIIFDLQPPRLDDMKSAGITTVQILGAGSDDCPACVALQGIGYAIEDAPTLPPRDCKCVPWCRCVETAKQ